MADANIVSLNASKKPEPKGKFNPGDVVALTSGGSCMTVRKAGKTSVIVDWINETGDLCTAEFSPPMLKSGDLSIEDDPKDGTDEA